MSISKSEKEFTRKLRLNSKKYRKAVIEKSRHCCEICGWSSMFSKCLNVHHIYPVNVYSKVFLFMKDAIEWDEGFQDGTPNEEFEMANQVSLCPNCHALVHQYTKLLGGESEWLIQYFIDEFMKHANSGEYSVDMVIKLKEISTGFLLKRRLSKSPYAKSKMWK